MKKMTERYLAEAFAGESQAHMRYQIFADQAEKEGFKNISRLYKCPICGASGEKFIKF